MVYCQHVLGIGHLCRILLLLEQMPEDAITLVLGGPRVDVTLPDHVRVVQLPGLRMDEEFSGLLPVEPGQDVAAIKEQRTRKLKELFAELHPDLLLIELYPFGRNAFHFELLPLLALARGTNTCKITCSVRDILVERDNTIKFEQRVIDRLNSYFHLLLIHGDPKLIPLEETFSRMDDITIPIAYTGYICRPPLPNDRERIRCRVNLAENDQLIVASAGSGSVGAGLLHAVLQSFALLDPEKGFRLQMFTGPHIADHDFARLTASASPTVRIERFTDDFPAWLAAADISISMGGYNTTMNLVAAGCRALVYPFGQNHEQRMRAERLARRGALELLSEADLRPKTLVKKIKAALAERPEINVVDIQGAGQTAQRLSALIQGAGRA